MAIEVARHLAVDLPQHQDEPVKLIPYDLPFLTDELRKRAKTELHEDEDTRISSLRQLRKTLGEEKDLVWQDRDQFLLAFLRARKFDVKRAHNLVKNFYHVLNKHDELYHNFDFADVKRTFLNAKLGFLPYRDEEGCVILIINTDGWNPSRESMADVMRALTTALVHAIRSPCTQVAGFKVIVDLQQLALRHLPHLSPTYLWLFAEALQNCFPGRFKAVHVVNEGPLFGYVWTILKQFLSPKIKNRFHFHGKHVKKLHQFFSPRILPNNYKGELPLFDNSDWLKQLETTKDDMVDVFSFVKKSSVN